MFKNYMTRYGVLQSVKICQMYCNTLGACNSIVTYTRQISCNSYGSNRRFMEKICAMEALQEQANYLEPKCRIMRMVRCKSLIDKSAMANTQHLVKPFKFQMTEYTSDIGKRDSSELHGIHKRNSPKFGREFEMPRKVSFLDAKPANPICYANYSLRGYWTKQLPQQPSHKQRELTRTQVQTEENIENGNKSSKQVIRPKVPPIKYKPQRPLQELRKERLMQLRTKQADSSNQQTKKQNPPMPKYQYDEHIPDRETRAQRLIRLRGKRELEDKYVRDTNMCMQCRNDIKNED